MPSDESNDARLTRPAVSVETALELLLAGSASLVLQPSSGVPWRAVPQLENAIVLPGAFNPLHAGHRSMADLAAARLKKTVVFEISVKNVDKPALQRSELARRATQFTDHAVCFSRAPTFVEKSSLFPSATFLVGADTISRIGQQRYYDGPHDAAFAEIAARGCRFLVYGRLVEGRFSTLGDLRLPESLLQICDEFSEDEFRMDISSTELRGRE